MSATHTSLDAAAIDRKARLAKLAGIKRKQPDSDTTSTAPSLRADTEAEQQNENEHTQSVTQQYLSGRNYDVTTKNAKLGFEKAPVDKDMETLEEQADRIAAAAAEKAAEDEAEAEKGIDLFKLQPKKPNWDLKRDLDEKMKILNVRTQNAIARLVRGEDREREERSFEKQSTYAIEHSRRRAGRGGWHRGQYSC